MIKLDYKSPPGLIDEQELIAYLNENRGIFEAVKKGEEEQKDNLGWLNVDEWAGDKDLDSIESIAKTIRNDADVFVLIGVGGSNNAARSVIKALQKQGKPEIIFAGNTISARRMNEIIGSLSNKSVYINIIAKNFETLEPGIAFRVLRKYLYDRYGEDAKKRIVATGTIGSTLQTLCRDNGYAFIPFPTNIGGRYTAMSSVGLLPMAVAGIDIRSIVQGGRDMRSRLYSEEAESNIAFRYAGIRNLLYRKGYKIEMLAAFEPQFDYFFKWWIQLFAESEGKDGKGLFPAASGYSEELHSVGQFVQDGSPVLFETFLDIKERQDSFVIRPDGAMDYFDYLNGADFWDINKAAFNATVEAHSKKLPCITLSVPKISEYYFGQLFYMFQFACYLSGKLLGVNPFDQPGVEEYKTRMFQRLRK